MDTFLWRHRRKGLLAFLLLLFKRGKGVGPLVLLVVIMSFIFILPSGFGSRIPWASKWAQKLGLRGFLGGDAGMRLMEMSESLRTARANRSAMAGWAGGFGGRFAGGAKNPNQSSTDMVHGLDPEALSRRSRGGKGGYGGYGDLGAPKSVSGILTPEDARRRAEGVSVDADELARGLLQSAHAGMFPGGGAGNAGGRGSMIGGFWSGRSAALDPRGELLNSAFASSKVPGVNGQGLGNAGGKLSGYLWGKLRYKISDAIKMLKLPGRDTAMYQLAQARAFSVVAAPLSVVDGRCPEGACPREFASHASGVPFVGGRVENLGIVHASGIGEAGAVVPGMGDIRSMIDQAEQMEKDAKQCEEAENVYGLLEHAKMAEMQALSDQLNAMNCGGGGCSASKAQKCKAIGNQMKAKCNEFNAISQQKAAACPLMSGVAASQC